MEAVNMFKAIRRQDRELTSATADDILVNGTYGVLSVSGDNGYAYGVPLSYVYTEGHIYFHCALEGQKLSCIRMNNKVTFCVVGKAIPLPGQFSMEYASTIVYGEATEVDGQEKQAVLTAFIDKYSPDYREKGAQYIESSHHKTTVIRIRVEHITGKSRKQ
jgi:nitroimidazol reductase NimA-like FMN-containing flavoprotein (pyridoxamine 5'-phosphate oxidase superfamily)